MAADFPLDAAALRVLEDWLEEEGFVRLENRVQGRSPDNWEWKQGIATLRLYWFEARRGPDAIAVSPPSAVQSFLSVEVQPELQSTRVRGNRWSIGGRWDPPLTWNNVMETIRAAQRLALQLNEQKIVLPPGVPPGMDEPPRLSVTGRKAYQTILRMLMELGSDEPGKFYTGGGIVFYSPAEWRDRGEEYATDSELIVTYDGGDVREWIEHRKMREALENIGLMFQPSTSWYGGVYRL